MTKDMSRRSLLEFLDFAGNKGLINSATVSARKAAVNKVLGILTEEEVVDVTSLDLDRVMDRFFNLNRSEYKPESLAAYKSRVRSSIEDFAAYEANPLGFRPASSSGPRKSGEKRKEAPSNGGGESQSTVRMDDGPTMRPAAANSIMPIPIRADLTVFVQGLPYDLTKAEANKIANVIKALAFTNEE